MERVQMICANQLNGQRADVLHVSLRMLPLTKQSAESTKILRIGSFQRKKSYRQTFTKT
jgi:hypothetical protein